MRILSASRNGIWVLTLCLCAQGQTPPSNESKGLPPRASPADYQAHTQVGKMTIAAEFARHGIPTAQGPLTTEDYVVVELGIFGPSGERATISIDDFSLSINGKKALPSKPYGVVLSSVKDPEWQPPEPVRGKSKTGLSSGDSGDNSDPPPSPPKMPMPLQHAMEQKVQKAVLPEGERALPQAGLLFFPYRGKEKSIQSVDLIYAGSLGKVTLSLHP